MPGSSNSICARDTIGGAFKVTVRAKLLKAAADFAEQ
jgi:hypothetical protein